MPIRHILNFLNIRTIFPRPVAVLSPFSCAPSCRAWPERQSPAARRSSRSLNRRRAAVFEPRNGRTSKPRSPPTHDESASYCGAISYVSSELP